MAPISLNFSSIIAIISLVISVAVAWLTLFRRGSLRMTQPVQVAFAYEGEKPKVFLRTLLYATGKRGHVIEGLYLKLKHAEGIQTFGFWGYGERNELMAGGGLRVTEEGVAYNHHFLQINEAGYFPEGDYEIAVYARIVNSRTAKRLATVKVALSEEEAISAHLKRGVLFTWDPDTRVYLPSFETKKGA